MAKQEGFKRSRYLSPLGFFSQVSPGDTLHGERSLLGELHGAGSPPGFIRA